MSVPLSQMVRVATYVLRQRLRGRRRYPLVLMLEPLFRCNLACAGCGKIQHPTDILRRHLTPEACFRAADQCGAPVVSIAGGEPLLHPQIGEIVDGLVARRKYVYLCTNALKLVESLDLFRPSKYLSFSVHVDGNRQQHDLAVCREGVFDAAIEAARRAIATGFRVTTNTTLYDGVDTESLGRLFDQLMALGVEGMMISPGYHYQKAPDQDHFLRRRQTTQLFRRLLAGRQRSWQFNQSPLFLEFLQGNWQLECTPWGNPTYNLFGWQRPCYLLDESYAATFDELMNDTNWEAYGRRSGNPHCQDCMVHCGYEPTAVAESLGTLRGLLRTARLTLFGPPRPAPPHDQRDEIAIDPSDDERRDGDRPLEPARPNVPPCPAKANDPASPRIELPVLN